MRTAAMTIDRPVRVGFTPGTHIEQAAHEAQAFADQIGAAVRWDHNGVTCEAQPGGEVGCLVVNYQRLAGAVANSSRGMSCFVGDLPAGGPTFIIDPPAH